MLYGFVMRRLNTRSTLVRATQEPAAPQRQLNAAALVPCLLNNACRRSRYFVVSIPSHSQVQCRYDFVSCRYPLERCSLQNSMPDAALSLMYCLSAIDNLVSIPATVAIDNDFTLIYALVVD